MIDIRSAGDIETHIKPVQLFPATCSKTKLKKQKKKCTIIKLIARGEKANVICS